MAKSSVVKQLERELQAKVDAGVAAARDEAHKLAQAIRANAPVDTGALRDSVRVVNTPEGANVVVGNGAVDYADDVEQRDPFIAPAVNAAQGGYNSALQKAVE